MYGSAAFGRTPSTSSIDAVLSPGSSTQNTDNSVTTDEEDSDHRSTLNYRERRREAHTQAEQKRRDAIKHGYEELQHLVPTCQQQDSVSSYKLSKATILQRSIDYINYLSTQTTKMDEQLSSSQKKVRALQIMKRNWESMVQQQQQAMSQLPAFESSMSQMSRENQLLMDENVKLRVFQSFCDDLFLSFNESVSFDNFEKLSQSVFHWLEEYCKPQKLKNTTHDIIHRMQQ